MRNDRDAEVLTENLDVLLAAIVDRLLDKAGGSRQKAEVVPSVILSAAKDLKPRNWRSFAPLRMTSRCCFLPSALFMSISASAIRHIGRREHEKRQRRGSPR